MTKWLRALVIATVAAVAPGCLADDEGGAAGVDARGVIGADLPRGGGELPPLGTFDAASDRGADTHGDPGAPPSECDDGDPCTWGDRRWKDQGCVGEAYECPDDGRPCTVEACDGLGGCEATIGPGACLIDGRCVDKGAALDDGSCATCDPAADPTGWTPTPDGPAEGLPTDACRTEPRCEGGALVWTMTDCDDGEPCTAERCDPAEGCSRRQLTGPCDDGDACTAADHCAEGRCRGGVALRCDDGEACTDDACDPAVGCLHEARAGGCEDGDACTLGDACVQGACQPGGLAPDCDDGNDCTADACDAAAGCRSLLITDDPCCAGGVNPCDDGDPCTRDGCGGGDCSHEPHEGACSDGDVCTTGDTCATGECAGVAVVCDDGDPCTADACDARAGCTHAPVDEGAACDDGDPCTGEDACSRGVCAGSLLGCSLCPPPVADDLAITVTVSIGADGQPGSGLDVDRDEATCAPANDCAAGIDNAMAVLASFINPFLEENAPALLIELRLDDPGGATAALLFGEASDEACDPATTTCAYAVDPLSWDATCQGPLVSIPVVEEAGGAVRSLADAPPIVLSFDLGDGAAIALALHRARLDLVTDRSADGRLLGADGVIAGAVAKQALLDNLTELPDDVFPAGVSRSTILGLLNAVLQSDIDADGDGVRESASIGIPFTARAAQLAGGR